MTFQRILLLNRNHIGDCLFTTPAIRALRTAYPEAVLVAAVPPVNRDLLESNPCLSAVLGPQRSQDHGYAHSVGSRMMDEGADGESFLLPRPSSPPGRRPGAMELHVSLEHRAKADALLATLGVTEDAPLIGINPGASM